MLFDPENTVVKLCAQGMELEGQGDGNEALLRFEQAWAESTNDTERCIAAHYVAGIRRVLQISCIGII